MNLSATIDLASAAARWDVIVIGAGPAGATAACLAARHRSRVLLVERWAFPRDKVCGSCVNVRALAALRSAGLGHVIDHLPGVALRALHVACGRRTARIPLPGGLSISRARLDAALVAAAIDAGAAFLPETTAALLPIDGSSPIRQVRLSTPGSAAALATADVVLAADGLGNPSLRLDPGFASIVRPGARIGVGAVLPRAPQGCQPGVIYMTVGQHGYVGLTAIEEGQWTAAAALDARALGKTGNPGALVADLLSHAGQPPIDSLTSIAWRGTRPLTQRAAPLAAPGVFVLGDAAGYVEPFTGEGIGWAIASAVAVQPLVERAATGWDDRLARQWRSVIHRQVWRGRFACRALAAGLRYPLIARGALLTLTYAPGLTDSLVRRVTQGPPH
jgi:flavin-dependent dehydrogenase